MLASLLNMAGEERAVGPIIHCVPENSGWLQSEDALCYFEMVSSFVVIRLNTKIRFMECLIFGTLADGVAICSLISSHLNTAMDCHNQQIFISGDAHKRAQSGQRPLHVASC